MISDGMCWSPARRFESIFTKAIMSWGDSSTGFRRQVWKRSRYLRRSPRPAESLRPRHSSSLLATMLDCLDRAGPLAGILAAPHGAGVSESSPAWMGIGWAWFASVLALPSRSLPPIDPHANLSLAMVNACQAIIPYRTNPHVDQHARGLEAASLMVRTLRGEVRPTMAAAFPTVAINIAAQHTESPPCLDLVRLADAQLKFPGVLGNGVVLGFPYADVPEMGSSFIVVTDNDQERAGGLADQLGNYLVAHRRDFVPQLPSVEEAIDLALRSEKPVCLLDLGDNVGGGSPGDGTIIARALRRRRIERSFVALCDADAANAAASLGAVRGIRGTCRRQERQNAWRAVARPGTRSKPSRRSI